MQAVQYTDHGRCGAVIYGETEDALERVWDGTFTVETRATLPTSETARGHGMVESREGFGNVVVPDSEYDE